MPLFQAVRSFRVAAVAVLAVAATLMAAVPPPAALAVDVGSPVVISEVYGGGGNAGASWTNDFVELYNRGSAPVDLTGWSVQYASAAGTSWAATPLVGTISPGQLYLVQEGSGGTSGSALPSPNATGTLAMSASSGKVALVSTTTALSGCASTCSSAAGVADFVGYGTANDAAGGHPAPGLGNALSAQRRLDPFADTGDNGADFTAAAPTPKAAPAAPSAPDCTTSPPPPECVAGTTTIQDIQGSGFLSPLVGQTVERVAGIVTAVRSGSGNGFWLQQPARDASRPAASSALFVFGRPTVKVGDSVLVTGTVTEFYQKASGETDRTTSSLSTTEISPATTVTVVSSGNPLPAAVPIGATTVPDRYAPTPPSGSNVETVSPLDPTRSVLEFWEAHEGMLVSVADVRVVGPGKAEFGEIYVTTKPDELRTPRGGTYLAGYDRTPTGRLLVVPLDRTVPSANVGDVLAGPTVGPVDWSTFGGYAIAATSIGTRQDRGLARTVAAPQAADQLAVATYNVENLAPGDPDTKYARLAEGVVRNLASPDVVAVEEIQDNSGATDDGTVAADRTVARLVAAIQAAGGPAYSAASIDPVNDQDGGQPGGNIRVAFLYNPSRVTFAAAPPGGALDPVQVGAAQDGTATLSLNPGRVDPTDSAWTASRKPLAGEFVFQGRKVIVVANHFNSKGGDQSADGRFQPPNRSSEVQRLQQATVLNGFVQRVLAADPDANVVLAGDFNDYQFSPALTRLTDDGATLTDLVQTLPENERYTYVFNGVSQVLDHILVTKPVRDLEYQVVHVNAEFADQVSDHDPQVVRIRLSVREGTLTVDPASVTAGGTVAVRLAGWYPNREFSVLLDDSPVGAVTTDSSGAAVLSLAVPASTADGSHTVSVSSADGAVGRTSLTVEPAAPPAASGSVTVLPDPVYAGFWALVVARGWAPGTRVTLSIDGSVPLGVVRTTASGFGLGVVPIPRSTERGAHTLVATGPDGSRLEVPLRVR